MADPERERARPEGSLPPRISERFRLEEGSPSAVHTTEAGGQTLCQLPAANSLYLDLLPELHTPFLARGVRQG